MRHQAGRRRGLAARSGGVKLVIILALALAMGAGAGWFVWGRANADDKRSGRGSERESSKHHEEKKKGDEHASDEEQPELAYVNMGAFLVNVASTEKLRYVQVEITLGVHTPEEEGKKKREKTGHGGHGGGKAEEPTLTPASDALARDTIVRVLSSQSFDQLQDPAAREKLRVQLHHALQEVVKDTEVHAVLFTSFLMQ
ncbi:MAG: flagellar basal body-associated FliL family protein [Armatimonadetes bacterium]|nr:flagellar basal body-associated FliL family protein [Armatimonadota bacterium]MDI9584327.1 flagellar basal body-associated FliL family protein [Acidobacteriota bacterium]